MLTEVYDTIRGLIYYGLPKDVNNKAIIFDKPIQGWYYGDRTILSESPSIVIQGETSNSKDIAFGTKELTHTLTISCWMRHDDPEILERNVLEFTRLVHESLLPHRRIWVVIQCPFCNKRTLSPEHFLNDPNSATDSKKGHADIFGDYTNDTSASNTYVGKVLVDFEAIWNQTHNTTAPKPPKSGVATVAFDKLYEDVRDDVVPAGVSAQQIQVIKAYQANNVRPIRMLYDAVFSDIKPVKNEMEKQLFRGGEFTLEFKELIRLEAFGPDNVPDDAW